MTLEQDPVREQSAYLSRKQRQQLLDEHDVQGWTIVQFLGDSVLIPAGAMFQVQSRHSVSSSSSSFSCSSPLPTKVTLLSLLPPSNRMFHQRLCSALCSVAPQVQNLHSCVQVINDFVSPEHVSNSFHLTQELRPSNEEVNYEDKLQVMKALNHVKETRLHSTVTDVIFYSDELRLS